MTAIPTCGTGPPPGAAPSATGSSGAAAAERPWPADATRILIAGRRFTNRPSRDSHVVEFDAAPHEQCWSSGETGGGCTRRAETDVGLCLECRDRIRGRMDERP